MHTLTWICFVLALFVSLTPLVPCYADSKTPSDTPRPFLVIIDPGHGGEDEGASFNNIKEKHISLSVAQELEALVSQTPGLKAQLTRSRDVFISLDDRIAKTRSLNGDMLVSIHVNSSPSHRAKGTEFYFENQIATDEESLFLANRENSAHGKDNGSSGGSGSADLSNILNDLARSDHIVKSQLLSEQLLAGFRNVLKVNPRAIRQAPFRVLSVPIPATLVELGFVSHPSESIWMSKYSNQKLMARALLDGIKSFKEKLDKSGARPLR